MKKYSWFLMLFFLCTSSVAQTQWKFYIAFEEALGQRDTIWMVWDSTAHGTFPIDTTLGEGAVNLDYSNFNVWAYNQNGDTTNTIAYPFSVQTFMISVEAFNYQYPLTITWDSALLSRTFSVGHPIINIARIDNDYFFFQNNDNLLQAFNMLLENHADAPAFNWFSKSQFPMQFYISRTPGVEVEELNFRDKVFSYPSPVRNSFTIKSNASIGKVRVMDFIGQYFEFKSEVKDDFAVIDISKLPSAIYFIEITDFQNQIYFEKIVKTD